ncbi:MAG: mechanosensitive ion channel [Candidatus Lokiarchaeota archaeon]|nr:mechanosensitive ion channel [Candidatus Lokiarchaeota archaeon]
MAAIHFLYFGIFVLIIIGIYKLIMYAIKKLESSNNVPIDAINGIKTILRILFFIIVIFVFFKVLGVEAEYLIPISSISGVIIGFASSEVMSQIVSGIYIITTQPFDVHDLVNIDGLEGIVVEIGFNCVIIQKFDGSLVKMPNKKILDSKIKNYTLKMTEELKNRQKYLPKKDQLEIVSIKEAREDLIDFEKATAVLGNLSDFIFEDEVTRYIFDIQVDLSIDAYEALAKLEKVSEKYSEIFNYTPKFFIVNLGRRATFGCRIYCTNPRTIMDYYNNILEDVVYTLYTEEGVK